MNDSLKLDNNFFLVVIQETEHITKMLRTLKSETFVPADEIIKRIIEGGYKYNAPLKETFPTYVVPMTKVFNFDNMHYMLIEINNLEKIPEKLYKISVKTKKGLTEHLSENKRSPLDFHYVALSKSYENSIARMVLLENSEGPSENQG